MVQEHHLFVVSGPSGVGKDSVVKKLRANHPEIAKTISATTRAPREGEKDGVDYFFCTEEKFKQLVADDQIVEHNLYSGNYYGTLRSEVERNLSDGKFVVLVIDVHGAANIKRLYPRANTIFLLPPSVEVLESRLRGRGTETEDSVRRRLAEAKAELAIKDTFDSRVVNNDIDVCAQELYSVIADLAKRGDSAQ